MTNLISPVGYSSKLLCLILQNSSVTSVTLRGLHEWTHGQDVLTAQRAADPRSGDKVNKGKTKPSEARFRLVIHESGSDNSFQRYDHSKFSKMSGGRILDLVQPEVGSFDPPSRKPYLRTKHEVDRMTRCRDVAVRNFTKCEVGRSVVNITFFSYTPLRYVRNVAREE